MPYGALVLRLTAAGHPRRIVGGRPPAARAPTTPAAAWSSSRWPRSWPTGPARPSSASGSGTPSVTAFPGYEDPSELDDDEFDFEDFSRKVRRVPELAAALDRMWPRLSPHELLHDLYGAPPLIAAAARGILTAEEQALLAAAPLVVVRRGGLDAGRRRPGRRGPPPARARATGAPTRRCASTATSWSTRSRTCRPCSCGC